MSEGAIVTLIVAIFGVVGGGGFWTYRQSRREAPVRQRDADLVVAERSQQMALQLAQAIETQLNTVKADFATEKEERTKLSGRVDGLEKQVRRQSRMISAWEHFYADLAGRWHYHRQSDAAPAGPQATTE